MKRLLRISLDTLISSLMSISIWIILSITVEKNLINIFTLTYPIQYLSCVLKSIFATGANISKQKGNSNDVMSGILIGTIFSIVLFGILLFNLDLYLDFMNLYVDKSFVAYSIIQILLQTLLSFVLTKLYYEEKNVLANKYSITFYFLNFICILVTSLLYSQPNKIIVPTITILLVYIIYIMAKSYQKFDFKFNLKNWIKYDAVELSNSIFLGLAYLFGLSTTVSYGESYSLALTFIALITDTQWDISSSISTVAKIDISKNKFNYRTHINNALKLATILIISVLFMFGILFHFYDLNLSITLIFLSFLIVDFMLCPFYNVTTCYLQLEYSAIKTTSTNLSVRFIRLLLSFLRTPFCTVIAQVVSSICQVVSMSFIFSKRFRIGKSGNVEIK